MDCFCRRPLKYSREVISHCHAVQVNDIQSVQPLLYEYRSPTWEECEWCKADLAFSIASGIYESVPIGGH
jgi:hypothetical protein